jgi:Flp pilus assembly protein TadD
MKAGGRDPATLKTLADDLQADGQEEGSRRGAGARQLYLSDGRNAASATGTAAARPEQYAGAIREFQAVLARDPIDPAQAHFNLARAYNQNHQTEQAKDELISSLEAAPGFRPAQKLLLELSGPEK